MLASTIDDDLPSVDVFVPDRVKVPLAFGGEYWVAASAVDLAVVCEEATDAVYLLLLFEAPTRVGDD